MINPLKTTFILLLALIVNNKLSAQNEQTSVSSPDKQIEFRLSVKDHQLYYQVAYHKQVVMEPSALGITVNNKTTNELNEIGAVKRSTTNETYPWRGVHSTAVNHSNNAIIEFKGTA